MLTKQTKFLLAIALQVVIIFTIVIFKVSVLSGGTDVILRIEPVDPRDMLRGDYATFQYDISTLDAYLFGGQQISNGDTVYVSLRQSGEYWLAQNIQRNKPLDGGIFIKGTVVSGGIESQSDNFQSQRLSSSMVNIIYGIEDYFIPEGKGQGFSFWDKESAAKVAVDENGNAVLKQLYVDGKTWP